MMPGPGSRQRLLAAVRLFQAGDHDAAAELCRRGLEDAEREGAPAPLRGDFLHLLAGMAHQEGRERDALDLVRQAIACNAAAPGFHFTLGLVSQALGEPDAAAKAYRACLRLDPGFAPAHGHLGSLLESQGRLEEALAALGMALHLTPDADTACHLGALLQRLSRADAAIPVYRAALRIRPDCAEAQAGLGGALLLMGQPEEALAACRTAVRLGPDSAGAYCNLGCVLRDLGESDAAVAAFHTALRLWPGFPEAESNLGMALLERGDMAEGWRNFQGGRLREMIRRDRVDRPPLTWNGEAGEGRTLLVRAEHGLGDTIQLCRLAPLATERGLHVVMEVPPPLVRLLGSLAGVERVIAAGDEPPPCDLQCPVFALPLLLETTLATIPRATPYLHADPRQVETWRARLAAAGRSGARVGLVWAGRSAGEGSFHRAMDRCRSMAPDQLAPLLDVPGLHFISLQKTAPLAPAEFGLTDFMGEMHDLADTAALVANLDLVVTVDSALAHLAGALGRPVWLMDRFNHCWRWLNGRRDSPWYPQMRIYRQPRRGDWGSVIAAIARDLQGVARA